MKNVRKCVLLSARRICFFKFSHDNALSKTCSDEIESVEISRSALSRMCFDNVESIEIKARF